MAWLLLAAIPAAAMAQDAFVPRLHDVTDVATDDALNVRAAPSASAAIVGTLDPRATGIEVSGLNPAGTWGRISAGEIDGWVSMSYLAERPFPPGTIPSGLRCLGTEPFWSLAFGELTANFSSPYEDWPDLPLTAAAMGFPGTSPVFGFDTGTPAGRLSGVIEARECNDGMSDRSYGWSVVLLHVEAGDLRMETGCCSLDQR